MILTGAMVVTTIVRQNPLALNSRPNSASVRSWPPDMSSMLRSSKLANETSLDAGRRLSITRIFPESPIARLQFFRMLTAELSSQSCSTFFKI